MLRLFITTSGTAPSSESLLWRAAWTGDLAQGRGAGLLPTTAHGISFEAGRRSQFPSAMPTYRFCPLGRLSQPAVFDARLHIRVRSLDEPA